MKNLANFRGNRVLAPRFLAERSGKMIVGRSHLFGSQSKQFSAFQSIKKARNCQARIREKLHYFW